MPEGVVLAFDFGTKRIGVAVGEAALGQGRPLTTIDAKNRETRFLTISELIEAWQPSRLVVGLPLRLDGGEHELTRRCRRFANQLHGRFGLPVELVDERLTSVAAEVTLKDGGYDWKTRKAASDAMAAKLILQDYFDAATRRGSAL